jgi:hypothetical protein
LQEYARIGITALRGVWLVAIGRCLALLKELALAFARGTHELAADLEKVMEKVCWRRCWTV